MLEDLAGNNYTGIAGSSYYFDVADSSIPIVLSTLPALAAVDQLSNVSIFIQFDEYVQVGAFWDFAPFALISDLFVLSSAGL